MVAVYKEGAYLVVEDSDSILMFPFDKVFLNAVKNSETIGISDSEGVFVLGQTPYADLTDKAGQPLGNSFESVVTALSNIPATGSTVNVSNFPATQPISGTVTIIGVATSAKQDILNAKDFATSAKQDTLNGKDFATSAKQDTLNQKDFATSAKQDVANGLPFYDRVSAGLVAGTSFVKKAGRNPDIDTASVPEDLWNGGGVYTGFPTGSPEELQVFSSSASDTGTLTIVYLASSTSTDYQSQTVTLQGTTIVNTGITAYRVHTASYNTGTANGANVGNITVRHRTTTSNLFCFMPVGTNQTYVGGYTVPAGKTALLKSYSVNVGGGAGAYIEGVFFTRATGASPRYRKNYFVSVGTALIESFDGSIAFPAGTDIMPRITFASTNNLLVNLSYDLLLTTN